MTDKPKSGWGGARPNSGGARPGAGRKPIPVQDRQVNLSITLAQRYIEQARELGGGNASAGIRRALDMAAGRNKQESD
jgi:hypothetical protein